MTGASPALIRDVNADVLGRPVHNSNAQKPNTKVTAFLGRPWGVTLPTQEENGRAPSLAIANMRRDAASTMMAILFIKTRVRLAVQIPDIPGSGDTMHLLNVYSLKSLQVPQVKS
jgi:hypothetical protein